MAAPGRGAQDPDTPLAGAPVPVAVFNVVDDEPAPSPLPIVFAAGLLGVAPPPLEQWEEAAPKMTAMARSFWGESKRVRNAKIRAVLGWRPRYPTCVIRWVGGAEGGTAEVSWCRGVVLCACVVVAASKRRVVVVGMNANPSFTPLFYLQGRRFSVR